MEQDGSASRPDPEVLGSGIGDGGLGRGDGERRPLPDERQQSLERPDPRVARVDLTQACDGRLRDPELAVGSGHASDRGLKGRVRGMDTGHPCQKHQGGAKVPCRWYTSASSSATVQAARVLPEQLLEQHAGRAQMADRNRVAGAGDELSTSTGAAACGSPRAAANDGATGQTCARISVRVVVRTR